MTYFRKIDLPPECNDIYFFGDLHIGDLFYEPRATKNLIAYLEASAPGVVYIMGDIIRGFPYSDRLNRADETAATPWPTVASQLTEAETILSTIPEQHHVFLHKGNHENHAFRETGDLYVDMAARLGFDYVGFQAATLLHWPGRYTRVLTTHGHKGIPFSQSFDPQLMERHRANSRIALRRILTKIDGAASDIYAMGHTHLAIEAPPLMARQMHNTGSRFVERTSYVSEVNHPVWCFNTGSCTKSFPPGVNTYADEAMYGPSDMAFIHIRLDDKTKKPLKMQNSIVELT